MGRRYAGQPRQSHGPQEWEVSAWKRLAAEAIDVAHQRTTRMGRLSELGSDAVRMQVFGPEGDGNVCTRLIEVVHHAARSSAPSAYFPDLDRLAREVLRHVDGYEVVRRAERYS